MTGTTLFTVSRLLSAWEARGMVRPRREAVAICDVQSLRAIGKGDESLYAEDPVAVSQGLPARRAASRRSDRLPLVALAASFRIVL